ncbi:Zinc finger, RING-type [Dillenia turbinata]|uniref:RING-type E3 ubiquitin transferase n=1 Tax=Dillenia turbinata TaxID=194707 RepID=A0AAN8UHF3_9MAGN
MFIKRKITSSCHGFSPTISVFCLVLSHVVFMARAQSSTPDSQDLYDYGNFSPSMATIIMVLVGALFFVGFFSIYIRNCTEARSLGGSVRPMTGPARRSRRGMIGLDAAVIETFPTMVYSDAKEHKIGKGALECAVCLNEFEDDETLRLLPKCDHAFHPECIDEWLSSHTTCPVCRANLVPQPGESILGVPEFPSQVVHSDEEIDTENRREQPVQTDIVSVHIGEEEVQQQEEVVQQHKPEPKIMKRILSLNQNRPPRSKSTRPRKFLRSHSTGHSLVQPGQNVDRFTLKLPEDVRKQILNQALDRSKSCVVLPREGSTRRGIRVGGEGSSGGRSYMLFDRIDQVNQSAKSDRWVFSMAPPFITRAPSPSSPKADVDGEGSSTSKNILTAFRASFRRIGSKKPDDSLASADSLRSPV